MERLNPVIFCDGTIRNDAKLARGCADGLRKCIKIKSGTGETISDALFALANGTSICYSTNSIYFLIFQSHGFAYCIFYRTIHFFILFYSILFYSILFYSILFYLSPPSPLPPCPRRVPPTCVCVQGRGCSSPGTAWGGCSRLPWRCTSASCAGAAGGGWTSSRTPSRACPRAMRPSGRTTRPFWVNAPFA